MRLADIALGLGWGLMAFFGALTAVEAWRYFRAALFPAPESATPRTSRADWPRAAGMLAAGWALSRLLMLLTLAVCQWVTAHGFATFANNLAWFARRWDAKHYLALIESGYQAEGDTRLLIVFLPLYPAVCRAVCTTTGLSARASALLVSNACLLGCGAALYALLSPEDARRARRAVLLFLFCPVTFFYSLPYSESLFLLLTLLSTLCARRRRWIAAVAFGALAANARILGMAVAVPVFWEMLRDARRTPKRPMAADIALCALRVLPISLGLMAYLLLNARVFGNPFQFLIFQREQWNQSAGTLAWSFQVSFVNLLTYEKALYRLGVWGPQVLLMPAIPALILWRRRAESPADAAYALVYHYVSFMPTWLLSGARYASAMYPLYPMLARIPRTRRQFALMLGCECALLIYMTVIGVWHGHVM